MNDIVSIRKMRSGLDALGLCAGTGELAAADPPMGAGFEDRSRRGKQIV
jgi:hypothetical protein